MKHTVDEEFRQMNLSSILKQSLEIPRVSPETFFLLALFFILPLSLAIIVHSYIIHSLLDKVNLNSPSPDHYGYYVLAFFLYFIYIILTFTYSLLVTSAFVFTVASLYTSSSVSFTSTVNAIPRILPHVFLAFLWILLFMVALNAVFIILAPVTIITVSDTWSLDLSIFIFLFLFLAFTWMDMYMISVWQLASVVSVMEPVYGWGAMTRGRELIRGRTVYALVLTFGYAAASNAISAFF